MLPSPTWSTATATWEEPCQQQHLLLPQGLSLCGETAVTREQGVKTGARQDLTGGKHPGMLSVGKLQLQEEHPFLRGSLQDGVSEEGQCMSHPGEVQVIQSQ